MTNAQFALLIFLVLLIAYLYWYDQQKKLKAIAATKPPVVPPVNGAQRTFYTNTYQLINPVNSGMRAGGVLLFPQATGGSSGAGARMGGGSGTKGA